MLTGVGSLPPPPLPPKTEKNPSVTVRYDPSITALELLNWTARGSYLVVACLQGSDYVLIRGIESLCIRKRAKKKNGVATE